MLPKQLQTGVTMIELLVVLAVAVILATIAVPSFSLIINNTRLSSTMTQLTGDLNRARVEAIKRNTRMLICVRGTNTACGTGTNWQNGWLVCYDEEHDGTCDTASATNPNPIVVRQAINSHLTLTGGAASIYFNPNGTQGAGGAATLTLSGDWAGAVNNVASISATGNISKTP